MELHDYTESARARQLDFQREFRKAEMAGIAREPKASSRRGWFARITVRWPISFAEPTAPCLDEVSNPG